MTNSVQILTDATSGNSSEFKLPDGSIIFQLVIVGLASQPINAFVATSTTANNLYLTIRGLSGSGARIKLQAKTNHSNDSFGDTGESWDRDYGGPHYLQSKI